MSASVTPLPTRPTWTELADELGRAFADRAAALDAEGRFAEENFAELRQRGLIAAGVPTTLGGGGAEFRDLAAMLRRLAGHCGSTALALSMHTHLVAALVWRWQQQGAPVEPVLRRIATEQLYLVSTGGNDWLDSGGTAEAVPGGYRIHARKPFASGQPFGDLLMTTAVLDDPAAGRTVLHFAVPLKAEGVRIAETWDTLGMRATGSNDVLLEGVFVPEAAVSVRRPAGLWHPSFHLISKIAIPLIYSVYLGIAESARELALAGLSAQQRGDPLLQLGVGEMENALATARLALDDMVEAGATLPPGPETTNRVFIGRSLVAEAAIRCTERAMELAGGRSFYRRTGLERRFRDIQAARFHPLRAKEQLLYAGRMALGMPIDG